MLLFSSVSFGQRKIIPDTIPIIIYYSDTSCHFDKNDVMSIYNSHCMKETTGYVIFWMYYTEILWSDKKTLPKSINYWFYKLQNNGKRN